MSTNHRKRGNRNTQARHSRGAGKSDKRANWQRQLDLYLQRARTAAEAGDRIEAENFYQHADHYFRLLNETAA